MEMGRGIRSGGWEVEFYRGVCRVLGKVGWG